jgi:hypothetical protein
MMKVKLPRRTFLYLAAGAAALPVVSSIAWAQAYPTRPVRFIHGFAAGGSGDIAARLIAQLLSDRLGQQFIVENRTGAGGNIAVEAVARAPADGYTLLQLNVANAINTALYEKLNFNLLNDIVPVASFMRTWSRRCGCPLAREKPRCRPPNDHHRRGEGALAQDRRYAVGSEEEQAPLERRTCAVEPVL